MNNCPHYVPSWLRALGILVALQSAVIENRAEPLAPVVDQEYTFDFNSGGYSAFAVATGWSVLQTFTVGVGGTLSQVDVGVFKGSAAVANLTMGLWSTTASGAPLGFLTSKSLPASAIDVGTSVVSFTGFTQPVTPGTVLAIRLDSLALNDPPFDMRYSWLYKSPGDYSRGRSYIIGNTTLDQAATDFYFRTIVTPVPEPSAAMLTVVGLLAVGRLIRIRCQVSGVR